MPEKFDANNGIDQIKLFNANKGINWIKQIEAAHEKH
jgi:hypothetical protein